MSESITISKKTPGSKSQQYDFLREEGLKYIQKMAGKIWTDYNIHDPGVSILEVLAYAITELGYRASYNIEDLLANGPGDKNARDIRNFFTAREILPNAPVTINDYRKLMIDVDVPDAGSTNCKHIGVKNAWIEKSKSNEIPVYVHQKESQLSYSPGPAVQGHSQLDIGILYDILLEFEKCDEFGDLNENSLTGKLVVKEHLPDTNVNGLTLKISVDFPRWDSENINWEDLLSVKSDVGVSLQFYNVPGSYEFSYTIVNKLVKLKGEITTASDIVPVPGLAEIGTKINNFIYDGTDSLLAFYRQKINKIKKIVEAVKARLHANRNLCVDFYKLCALRVEKIAVCADIELAKDADVESVQAEIYHKIGKFLSPAVYFYTLEEMLDKCKKLQELSVLEIDITNKFFKVDKNLNGLLNIGGTFSITGSRSNDGEYTVKSVTIDTDTSTSKVYVTEDISSDLLTEGELFTFYIKVEDECLSVDRIFEGPALEHGFIDNAELEKADRKKYIHVSGLIQIIMDVKGVISVKTIQIANIPLANKDDSIESKAVKWCLQLAFEQNYVPRLSVTDSKIVFYKDQLPFRASAGKVDELIEVLENEERVAKLYNPVLDFEVPKGIYRNLESYETIQNEFPLTYGIGDEGLPNHGKNKEYNERRQASARQLKGYLMHFDQLLANYFSQLAHVKDLFSMNPETDGFGNYIIGRTYYTQPLFDIVPNVDELYVDKNGHEVSLNAIAESEKDFYVRKNKFLDHLIGRFAENFTDYALLTIQITGGIRASNELVADKLAFLNVYPAISSLRGTGFNQQEQCKIWHIGNISGLRRRAGFLAGIDAPKIENLNFSAAFEIVQTGDQFEIQVSNSVPELLLKSTVPFKTQTEAKIALEKLIINGLNKSNYLSISDDGGVSYFFTLNCGDTEVLGISNRADYTDNAAAGGLNADINELVQLFTQEFYNNFESNRNNLACPLLNYIQYEINVDMKPSPPVAVVSYEIFAKPFSTDASDKLLTGSYTIEGKSKAEVDVISVDTITKTMVIDGNIAEKLKPGDILVVEDSQDNNGVYTVFSATDVLGTTEIVVDGAIPSDAVPLGELLYNIETEHGLQNKAEEQLHDIMWQFIKNASQKGKYYFSAESGETRFRIFNNSGIDLAESVASNFNGPLANEISNLVSGKVQITGSTGNNGEYTVVAATSNGADVTVAIAEALPSTAPGGTIVFTETFGCSARKGQNSFTIESDLTANLFPGDTIKITGSESVDGNYTIFSIELIGSETVMKVKEPVPFDDTGELSYSKSFGIEKVTPGTITFKGGYDEKAVQLFIGFIIRKFFSNEGFHVVEHLLLRPKVKGKHFIEAGENTFTEGLTNLGSLYFNETLPLFSISSATNVFRVEGNLVSVLGASRSTAVSSEIIVTGTGENDGVYQVKSVQYDAVKNRTAIKTEEAVYSTMLNPSVSGNISFLQGTAVLDISPENLGITVSDAETLKINEGEIVEIRGSTGKTNDGSYRVKQVVENGATQYIIISRVEAEVEDSLLPIVPGNDKCDDCQIQDPYTCIASVIIPHWQGRFDNMDFRHFFEKQIRMEAPAHVFLVICWISCEQMIEFEQKYKAWLIENARKVKDYGMLSIRLNNLIDVLGRLRNVYPSGTLYDCEKDGTLENAIILNNSVLGNG